MVQPKGELTYFVEISFKSSKNIDFTGFFKAKKAQNNPI